MHATRIQMHADPLQAVRAVRAMRACIPTATPMIGGKASLLPLRLLCPHFCQLPDAVNCP